jgi:hypothetical protein
MEVLGFLVGRERQLNVYPHDASKQKPAYRVGSGAVPPEGR